MPEGDTIERIAQRLQPLVGVVPVIATPHPRTAALRLPERLAGQALQRIEARGKHLLMVFDSGSALHVHLRMTGRLRVAPADVPIRGPAHARWLELAGAGIHAVLFDGPVLELLTPAQLALHPALRRLGGGRHGRRLRPRGGGAATARPRSVGRHRQRAARPAHAGGHQATSGAPRCCTPWASSPRAAAAHPRRRDPGADRDHRRDRSAARPPAAGGIRPYRPPLPSLRHGGDGRRGGRRRPTELLVPGLSGTVGSLNGLTRNCVLLTR